MARGGFNPHYFKMESSITPLRESPCIKNKGGDMEKVINKEFEGNVKIAIDKDQVRIWVCKGGKSIFRFKFLGDVHGVDNEFVVIGKKEVQ